MKKREEKIILEMMINRRKWLLQEAKRLESTITKQINKSR